MARMSHARSSAALVALVCAAAFAPNARALNITFDYSFDTSGFFNNASAVAAMEEAANYFEPLLDSLSPISPGGGNSWTAGFFHPSTGVYDTYVSNLSVGANEMIVYVGARELGGTALGRGGPGGWSASGSQSWFNTLYGRGEGNGTQAAVDGASAYEFGPWGGSIAFDTPRNWSFNLNGPVSGQFDFLSVAIHELGHVFGFGTADSFANLVSPTHRFNGPESKALLGVSYVPLHTDDAHWAQNTISPNSGQEASMDPNIGTGARKIFTPLDYAGLDDIGWSVPDYLIHPSGDPGDFDFDGDVDGDDFLIWQSNFGGSGPAGDADGDNDVDGDDFLIWQSNFGSGAASASVPEPAAGVLALLVWVFFGAHRSLKFGSLNR